MTNSDKLHTCADPCADPCTVVAGRILAWMNFVHFGSNVSQTVREISK